MTNIILFYILGIIVLIIDLAIDIQKDSELFYSIKHPLTYCIAEVLLNPSPVLFTSWYGVYINYKTKDK